MILDPPKRNGGQGIWAYNPGDQWEVGAGSSMVKRDKRVEQVQVIQWTWRSQRLGSGNSGGSPRVCGVASTQITIYLVDKVPGLAHSLVVPANLITENQPACEHRIETATFGVKGQGKSTHSDRSPPLPPGVNQICAVCQTCPEMSSQGY